MLRPDAEEIHTLIKEIFNCTNQILAIVNKSADAATKKKIQLALGTAMAELDLEILEDIYKQFPDLRPPEMEELRR